MENNKNTTANDFIKNEVLKLENRMFWGRILGSAIGYLLITLWLNSIRTTASIWFVWVLIIIQFALYFSIFIAGLNRSKVMFGLSNTTALIIFIILAVLGRINDWELAVIPLLIVIMLFFSARNKKVSEKGKSVLPEHK